MGWGIFKALVGSLAQDGASAKVQDPGESGPELFVPICPVAALPAGSSQSLGLIQALTHPMSQRDS